MATFPGLATSADLATATAQRQKQLEELFAQRRESAAEQQRLLAEGAALKNQIEGLREEFEQLQKQLAKGATRSEGTRQRRQARSRR